MLRPCAQEGEQELSEKAPATSLTEKQLPERERERLLLKSVSLPITMLPKAVSLSMPCPPGKEGRRLWARLPSILVSITLIALLVLSAVALCRSRAGGPVAAVGSAAVALPRKFLNKCGPRSYPPLQFIQIVSAPATLLFTAGRHRRRSITQKPVGGMPGGQHSKGMHLQGRQKLHAEGRQAVHAEGRQRPHAG